MSFSIDEWFVVALARTIRDREVVFHGFGSPCAQVAMHVARHTHAREMLLVEGATYAVNPDPPFIPPTGNDESLQQRRRLPHALRGVLRRRSAAATSTGCSSPAARSTPTATPTSRPSGRWSRPKVKLGGGGRRLQPGRHHRPPHAVDHPASLGARAGRATATSSPTWGTAPPRARAPSWDSPAAGRSGWSPSSACSTTTATVGPGCAQVFPDVSLDEVRAATGFELRVAADLRPRLAAQRRRAGRAAGRRPARGAPRRSSPPTSCAARSPMARERTARAERPRRGVRAAPGRAGRGVRPAGADRRAVQAQPGRAFPARSYRSPPPPPRSAGARPTRRWPPSRATSTWPWSSVPAPAVPEVIRDAAAKGVPAAIVIAGGFAEIGSPRAPACRTSWSPRPAPGASGSSGPTASACRTATCRSTRRWPAGAPPGAGGSALVTQSGAYGMAIHTLGPRRADPLRQGLRRGQQGRHRRRRAGALPRPTTPPAAPLLLPGVVARRPGVLRGGPRASRRRKPVIVAKTGRSAAGVRAARSAHRRPRRQRADAGGPPFDQAGVILARSGLEMMDAARGARRAAACRRGPGSASSPTPAVPASSWPTSSPTRASTCRSCRPGSRTSCGRCCRPSPAREPGRHDAGVEPVRRAVPAAHRTPGPVGRGRRRRARCCSSGRPSTSGSPSRVRDAVARLRADGVPVPVYVCWVAPRAARTNADLLQDAGVPCFEWPERTARALGHAARYARVRGPHRQPTRARRPEPEDRHPAGRAPRARRWALTCCGQPASPWSSP